MYSTLKSNLPNEYALNDPFLRVFQVVDPIEENKSGSALGVIVACICVVISKI